MGWHGTEEWKFYKQRIKEEILFAARNSKEGDFFLEDILFDAISPLLDEHFDKSVRWSVMMFVNRMIEPACAEAHKDPSFSRTYIDGLLQGIQISQYRER
jgi:hypothetical protein